MNRVNLLVAIVLGVLVLFSCKENKHEKHEDTKIHADHAAEKADIAMNNKYVCPMNCEDDKSYEEEGSCPVCKMDLRKEGEKHEEDHDNDGNHEHEK